MRPHPSPGINPLPRLSYTRILSGVKAPVRANPTISKVSKLTSTPPAMTKSKVPELNFSAAVEMAISEEEQAPSTVYPPPCKSIVLQTLPAIVFESPPANESSVISGKTDL